MARSGVGPGSGAGFIAPASRWAATQGSSVGNWPGPATARPHLSVKQPACKASHAPSGTPPPPTPPTRTRPEGQSSSPLATVALCTEWMSCGEACGPSTPSCVASWLNTLCRWGEPDRGLRGPPLLAPGPPTPLEVTIRSVGGVCVGGVGGQLALVRERPWQGGDWWETPARHNIYQQDAAQAPCPAHRCPHPRGAACLPARPPRRRWARTRWGCPAGRRECAR